LGWNNPEVTYEEVDCAENGYTDWNCQCADGATTVTPSATDAPTTAPASATKAPTAAPVPATEAPIAVATNAPASATEAPTAAHVKATKRPTKKPTAEPAVTKAQVTEAPIDPTEAPVAATDAPAPATEAPVVAATDAPVVVEPSTAATDAPVSSETESPSTGTDVIQIQVNGGSNAWWFGFSLVNIAVSDISSVEIKDSSENALWTRMSYQGNEYWNMYSVNPSSQMKAPLSLRFTGTNRNVVTADNIISAFQSATLDTGVAL